MTNLDLERGGHVLSRGRNHNLNQRTLISKTLRFYHYPVVVTVMCVTPLLVVCSCYPAKGPKAQRGCVTYSNLFWQSRNAKPVPESCKPVFFLLHLLKTQPLLSHFLQNLSEGGKGPRGVARGMGRGNIITEAWKLL